MLVVSFLPLPLPMSELSMRLPSTLSLSRVVFTGLSAL